MSVILPNSLAAQGRSLPPVRGTQTSPVHRMRGDVSTGNAPGPSIVNGQSWQYHEALRQSPDRTQLPFLRNMRPGQHLLEGFNRRQIAALGRYLVDNGGTPGYAVNKIADYATPVIPQAATDNADWNNEAEDFFAAWMKYADFKGQLHFFELQHKLSTEVDTVGDLGATMTRKGGRPQVRFYDTFHIGTKNGNDKYDGVRYDNDGVVQAYSVVEGYEPNATERLLSRNEFILLFDPANMCGYRGMSPLRKGSNDLRDGNDIKGFEKLAVKLRSALAGFIKGGTLEEDLWGDDSTPQEDGGNAPKDDDKPSVKKLSLMELLGGDIPVIDGEFQSIVNPGANVNVIAFLDYLSGLFVAGLDLPPAWLLDEKLTGPNIRSVVGKAQKKFDRRKQLIARFVEFCWLRVIGDAITTGQLKPQDGWWKITYQFPARGTIDLGDEATNDREDVSIGQMSRNERYGKRALDWEREEKQITKEQRFIIAECQVLSKETGVPLETLLTMRGIVGPAKEASQKNANEQNNKNAKEQSK